MSNADLGSDLEGDTEEATAKTLQNLRHDCLNVGGAKLAVLDHETNSDHADDSARNHDPLVVLGAGRDEAGCNAEDGQSQGLTV